MDRECNNHPPIERRGTGPLDERSLPARTTGQSELPGTAAARFESHESHGFLPRLPNVEASAGEIDSRDAGHE